jgi:hypothetical protein
MNVLFSLTDPMEQNDFYNPTRRPKQIALVTLNAQTQPMNAQTQPIPTITTTNIAATTTKITTETEAEEVEAEWTTTTQGKFCLILTQSFLQNKIKNLTRYNIKINLIKIRSLRLLAIFYRHAATTNQPI